MSVKNIVCFVFFALSLSCGGKILAQTDSTWTPPVLTSTNFPAVAPTSLLTANGTDSAMEQPMTDSDFVMDGVAYGKVLYLEGMVWIRLPSETTAHRLTEDEPIPEHSIIYTGFNGTLDFAAGPGMAMRLVPLTLIVVDLLPQPSVTAPVTPLNSATNATAPTPIPGPESAQVSIKKGTIFSALGRDDSAPIDFKVRTPEGVAGARGTMFATTASPGHAQVDMLHGKVNFETPDHQVSQIGAGNSQQIAGTMDGKFQFKTAQKLNPATSENFFNHAGSLLEHASGYGVVRRSLGSEVGKTLQERGVKLSSSMQQRFQNAGKAHFKNRPAFKNERLSPQHSADHTALSPWSNHTIETKKTDTLTKSGSREHPTDTKSSRRYRRDENGQKRDR